MVLLIRNTLKPQTHYAHSWTYILCNPCKNLYVRHIYSFSAMSRFHALMCTLGGNHTCNKFDQWWRWWWLHGVRDKDECEYKFNNSLGWSHKLNGDLSTPLCGVLSVRPSVLYYCQVIQSEKHVLWQRASPIFPVNPNRQLYYVFECVCVCVVGTRFA